MFNFVFNYFLPILLLVIVFISCCGIVLYCLQEFGIVKRFCCHNKQADCWCEQHTREKILQVYDDYEGGSR